MKLKTFAKIATNSHKGICVFKHTFKNAEKAEGQSNVSEYSSCTVDNASKYSDYIIDNRREQEPNIFLRRINIILSFCCAKKNLFVAFFALDFCSVFDKFEYLNHRNRKFQLQHFKIISEPCFQKNIIKKSHKCQLFQFSTNEKFTINTGISLQLKFSLCFSILLVNLFQIIFPV